MSTEATPLPRDVELCQAIIAQQREELVSLRHRYEQLEHRLDVLLRRMFGPRSERADPNQLALFALPAEASAPPPPPAPPAGSPAQRKRKGHGRRRLPENIERRRIPLDIDEQDKTCPCCGKLRRVIGEVVTERLGFEPTRFYVNEYVQLKYGCCCEQSGVVTAEKPIQPIEKGNAEPELVAYVAVSRFDDHSPYYRQQKGQFRRAGLEIPRSTLWGWMWQISELCLPLYDLMHDRVLRSKLLGTDDTPLPVLVPGNGKTQQGHIWAYRGDKGQPYNVFDFTMSHSHLGPLRFLRRDAESPKEAAFRGYLQADAGSPYDPIFRQCGDLIEVGCWAHTRRKFFEAKDTDLARGLEALARIKQLYEVEDAAAGLSPTDHLALRHERALPLLAALKTWLDEQYAKVLPRSAMGGALGYALGNWQALLRYTEDGEIPLDNNLVEQMLKLVAIGRKNWLFAGSERGGRTAAVLFTLISSAKRHALNTWAYLRDVFWRLADLKPGELEELLPDRWRDSHPPQPTCASSPSSSGP
jgi:transposase